MVVHSAMSEIEHNVVWLRAQILKRSHIGEMKGVKEFLIPHPLLTSDLQIPTLMLCHQWIIKRLKINQCLFWIYSGIERRLDSKDVHLFQSAKDKHEESYHYSLSVMYEHRIWTWTVCLQSWPSWGLHYIAYKLPRRIIANIHSQNYLLWDESETSRILGIIIPLSSISHTVIKTAAFVLIPHLLKCPWGSKWLFSHRSEVSQDNVYLVEL